MAGEGFEKKLRYSSTGAFFERLLVMKMNMRLVQKLPNSGNEKIGRPDGKQAAKICVLLENSSRPFFVAGKASLNGPS